jgi:hypothetical protein
MRRAVRWVGGLLGVLALSGSVPAEDAKEATIRVPTAEIRGGRSEVFPITGYLRQGQAVRIINEEGEFCAIVPPAGSANWIEDRAIKPHPNGGARPTTAHVLLNDVSVRLGSERAPAPLSYETVKLARGTIVRITGEKVFAEGKEWWPIQPPPSEVRYVAKASLSQPTTAVVSATPSSTTSSAKTTLSQPSNPLWVQAQQAEQVRDYAKAELLYRQLASESSQPGGDHDLAIRCYNRIEQLARATPTTWPARQPAPGMLVSGSRGVSAAPPPTTTSASPPANSISTGPGWLRRTGILLDGQPAYVLEDNRGQPKYYLMPLPGKSLEPFVNRPVEASGPVVQRPDFVGGRYISVYAVYSVR